MPPRSPERKRREEENKKREKEEKKAKKRRKRGNFVIYYIMLAIVAFIIFAILSVTVLFNAEGIVVEGETVYSDEPKTFPNFLSAETSTTDIFLS